MGQFDWLKVEIERLQERTWREFFLAGLHGTPGDNRATAHLGESPLLSARTLLELADSLPSEAPVQLGGIPIMVSSYVPTTEDRIVLDTRPILRRIFTGRLCGVRVEEIACDQIFLLEHDGGRSVVASPAAAAVLKLYPDEAEL